MKEKIKNTIQTKLLDYTKEQVEVNHKDFDRYYFVRKNRYEIEGLLVNVSGENDKLFLYRDIEKGFDIQDFEVSVRDWDSTQLAISFKNILNGNHYSIYARFPYNSDITKLEYSEIQSLTLSLFPMEMRLELKLQKLQLKYDELKKKYETLLEEFEELQQKYEILQNEKENTEIETEN